MTRPVRSIALYGFLGSGNIGNDASLETVLSWLRAEHADVAVSCITLTPGTVEARYGVPALPFTVPPEPGGRRLRTAAAKLAGRLSDIRRIIAAARSADATVVPGMGVLEETLGVRPWGFPTWLLLQSAACRLQRRPFVLVAVGAEPVMNPVTRWMFTATVRLATHVSYRDGFSAQSMRDAGAPPPYVVSADLAFAHPASRHADPEPGRIVVGVISYHGRHGDESRGASTHRAYVRSMAEVIVRLVAQGDQVVLVGGDEVDNDAAREILAEACRMRQGLREDAAVIRNVTTFAELSSEMARAEAVVASRFHNLISALRLARPTISLGYAEKNAELMRSVGLDDYCQHIDDLDADQLMSQLRAVRSHHLALTKRVSDTCDDYADEVRGLFSSLAADVFGWPRVQPAAAGRRSEDGPGR